MTTTTRARVCTKPREPALPYPPIPAFDSMPGPDVLRAWFLRELAELRVGEAMCTLAYQKQGFDSPAYEFMVGAVVHHRDQVRQTLHAWMCSSFGGMAGKASA